MALKKWRKIILLVMFCGQLPCKMVAKVDGMSAEFDAAVNHEAGIVEKKSKKKKKERKKKVKEKDVLIGVGAAALAAAGIGGVCYATAHTQPPSAGDGVRDPDKTSTQDKQGQASSSAKEKNDNRDEDIAKPAGNRIGLPKFDKKDGGKAGDLGVGQSAFSENVVVNKAAGDSEQPSAEEAEGHDKQKSDSKSPGDEKKEKNDNQLVADPIAEPERTWEQPGLVGADNPKESADVVQPASPDAKNDSPLLSHGAGVKKKNDTTAEGARSRSSPITVETLISHIQKKDVSGLSADLAKIELKDFDKECLIKEAISDKNFWRNEVGICSSDVKRQLSVVEVLLNNGVECDLSNYTAPCSYLAKYLANNMQQHRINSFLIDTWNVPTVLSHLILSYISDDRFYDGKMFNAATSNVEQLACDMLGYAPPPRKLADDTKETGAQGTQVFLINSSQGRRSFMPVDKESLIKEVEDRYALESLYKYNEFYPHGMLLVVGGRSSKKGDANALVFAKNCYTWHLFPRAKPNKK